MDMDLLLIMIMIITTTAIIGGSVNGVVQKVLDYKRSVAAMDKGASTAQPQQLIDDRADLIEDRLRVLERLATDRGTLLSDEIEALRSDVSARREEEGL